MAFTQQTLDELGKWVADMTTLTDAQARDLAKMYATAWDETSSALEEALKDLLAQAKGGRVSKATIARSTRLQRALAHITAQLKELAHDSGIRITGDLDKAVANSGRQQQRILQTMLPEEADVTGFDQVNKTAINSIVNRTTKQIESRLRKLPPEQERIMKRALIRGISVGSNPNEVARRIMKDTQKAFEGGAARASRIARTEMLDAMRNGARQVDLANKDVMQGWRWTASLDSRTCMACVGMNGHVFPTDASGPNGHPNCRCARVPLTKSWASLGFNIPEPPDIYPDSEKWFRSLSVGEQQRILGPDNLKSYTAGSFPITQWAVRKDNPGWRPSYVPAR